MTSPPGWAAGNHGECSSGPFGGVLIQFCVLVGPILPSLASLVNNTWVQVFKKWHQT